MLPQDHPDASSDLVTIRCRGGEGGLTDTLPASYPEAGITVQQQLTVARRAAAASAANLRRAIR